jgi:sortase A
MAVLAAAIGLVFALPNPAVAESPNPCVFGSNTSTATSKSGWTIAIPNAHLPTTVVQKSGSYINYGPAYWGDYWRPSDGGTVTIAGHRTTHGCPFWYLDSVRKGSRIYMRGPLGLYTYVAFRNLVLTATQLQTLPGDATKDQLILSACTPRHSAAMRVVVVAMPLKIWAKRRHSPPKRKSRTSPVPVGA